MTTVLRLTAANSGGVPWMVTKALTRASRPEIDIDFMFGLPVPSSSIESCGLPRVLRISLYLSPVHKAAFFSTSAFGKTSQWNSVPRGTLQRDRFTFTSDSFGTRDCNRDTSALFPAWDRRQVRNVPTSHGT